MSLLEAISPTAKQLLTPEPVSITALHCKVANWNGMYEVGTLVHFTRLDGIVVDTVTISQAWVSLSRQAMIKLAGQPGSQLLERVQVIQARKP